jgi:hypothetical protein
MASPFCIAIRLRMAPPLGLAIRKRMASLIPLGGGESKVKEESARSYWLIQMAPGLSIAANFEPSALEVMDCQYREPEFVRSVQVAPESIEV